MEEAMLAQDIAVLNRDNYLQRRLTDDFIESMSDQEFLRQFRFSKDGVTHLTDVLQDHLITNNNIANRITPLHQVNILYIF